MSSAPAPRPSGPATAMVTPEAVPLAFELANIGSRFVALLLDLLIQGAALVVLFLGLSILLSGADVSFGVGIALFLLIYFLVLFGYPIALETLWKGRTVGKAALGLRVVTKEGAPIRFRHAAIRAALGLVDFMLTYGAAAVICVLCTRDNQRVGDLVAGTIVLRERSGLRAPAPVGFSVPPGLETYAGALDLAGFTGEDYQAVRTFLTRAPSLPNDVRANLAVQLANPLTARVRPAPPQGIYPEAFLACLAAVYQYRQRAMTPPAPATAPLAGPAPAPSSGLSNAPPPAPAAPTPSPFAPPPPPTTSATAGEEGFSPPT
ncbi:MAG TPA: RDD family protein [Acidimicrobiales bacterium]|nr:RDD family protein [Acidimicrobiales bacterium]